MKVISKPDTPVELVQPKTVSELHGFGAQSFENLNPHIFLMALSAGAFWINQRSRRR